MKTLIVLLTVMLLIVSSALAAEKERVVVGIVDTNEPGWRAETLNPTIARLEKALPGRRIELLELSVYRTIDDVGRIRPDFIVAPSDVFLQLITFTVLKRSPCARRIVPLIQYTPSVRR